MAKEKKKKGKRITAGGNIGRTPTQTIVLQPTRRGGLDVSAYMDSIRQAELIDWPRRAKLIDLYADVMLDGHLFSVLRKRKRRYSRRRYSSSATGTSTRRCRNISILRGSTASSKTLSTTNGRASAARYSSSSSTTKDGSTTI